MRIVPLVHTIVFLSFSLLLHGQNNRLTATAQPDKISIGQISRLIYHYEGKTNQSIELPDLIFFKIVNGPQQRQSTTVINGKMSVDKRLIIDVMPIKAGTFKIPPASLRTKNTLLKSNPIIITVTKTRHDSLPVSKQLEQKGYSIIAEISKDTVFQGQQLNITYKLLASKDIKQYDIKHESKYKGSLRASYELNDPIQIDTIDGTIYREKVIRRRAIFPYQIGNFTIEPLLVNLYIEDDTRGTSGSYFFRSNVNTVRAYSNPLEFTVIPQAQNDLDSLLPTGSFVIQSTIPDSSYTTDDIIPMNVTIQGRSDPSLMRPPEIISDFPFSLADPSVKSTTKSSTSEGIIYQNTYDYYLQPQDTGIFTFQLFFPHMDTTGEVDTLLDQQLSIPIRKGKYFNRDAAIDVVGNPSESNFNLPTYLWIVIGVVLLGIAFLFYYLRKRKEPQENEQISSHQQAQDTIKSTLSRAESTLKKDNYRESVKYQLKALHQTAQAIQGNDPELIYATEEVYSSLKKTSSQATADAWLNYLEKLEKIQYGNSIEKEKIQSLQEEIRDWIMDKFSYFKDNK